MIIKKDSKTDEQKLNDILFHTDEVGDCMEWKGCFNTDGYARMAGNIKVHRLVYELVHKVKIDGLTVRHTCDNIKCINPKHLVIGSVFENIKDRCERGRTYKVVTKPIIVRVNELLDLKVLSQKEIAQIVGIDARRVSDISCGKYCSATGRFLGHG